MFGLELGESLWELHFLKQQFSVAGVALERAQKLVFGDIALDKAWH